MNQFSLKRISSVGPKSCGVRSGCYLRPDQFLDHLTVIINVLCKIKISQTPVSLYYSMQEDLSIPTSESALQVNISLQDMFFQIISRLHYIKLSKNRASNIKQAHCNCPASVIQMSKYEYENIRFEIMTRTILQNIFLFYNIAHKDTWNGLQPKHQEKYLCHS